MYSRKYFAGIGLVLAAITMSACSSNNKADNAASMVQPSAPAATPEAAASVQPSASAAPAATDQAAAQPAAGAASEGLPENLPDDFPLPEDAVISVSHSEENEGKKAALLIFKTNESMESVTKTYKDYFADKLGSEAVQTIDEKNLIIQGNSPDNTQVWSVIGGELSAEPGMVELNITWSEL
ncbi:hypothetical protein [Paenibacillus sp. DMB5]|uniref:hypothetical protein n=1 Tax=Paenibacillus sp. DMB5 TaxID=1780103 RepID=UPI00076D3ECB|nr:hypothetical protein [Paenibacillus sp. DMB5]KUP25017.1 hypothetical protein AWJ19_04830 [Paenibacillus sp. DMB5]